MSREAQPDRSLTIPLRVFASRTGVPVERRREPLTLGIPFPRGLLGRPHDLRLVSPGGEPSGIQSRALAYWPDRSVQWALVDFQADLRAADSATYLLHISPDVVVDMPSAVTVVQSDAEVVAETGTAQFSIRRGETFPFSAVVVDGRDAVNPDQTGLRIESDSGQQFTVEVAGFTVEERGPMRVAVLVTGAVVSSGGRSPLVCSARLHFFAGSATVRIELTITNRRRAEHPGGYWDLGDTGSTLIRDASLLLTMPQEPTTADIWCSAEPDSELLSKHGPLEIHQDSSGGENWQSSNHINRDRIVPTVFRGYRLTSGAGNEAGLRATPIVTIARDGRTIGITTRHFWQNFPKAIEAAHDSIVFRLWPRQSRSLHEIQGGEQKTQVLHVAFAADTVDPVPLNWCRSPLLVRADPEWYSGAGAAPYLMSGQSDADRERTALIQSAIEGDDSFERKREAVDEYGWRHFGDLYGDHETAFHTGPTPLVSHYNNQYDAIAGLALQFLRTGDPRWWSQMTELAAHVCDIDIYHTIEDKSAYNGGMFWHTAHYADADTATHRTYPRHAHAGSGGPSCEHNYATGLLLHHFLTGDARSKDAVLGLAQWVLDMDDGSKTLFRWIDRGSTGLASASGSVDYHGPGRGAGNSIRTLLDGYRGSGDRRFLDKAEELIRRCIHPNDSVDARNLLDAERRWFYTVFLQVLGRYLDDKIELGEVDHMYGYARASLLLYARWMAIHERPYLDHPEILEFPNETWAAQDIRKSDVLLFAAKHAEEAEGRLFRERAAFFYHYSTTTLSASPNHGRTRPTVLMLTNGFLHAYFAHHPAERASSPAVSALNWGEPRRFAPQKLRARKRALILVSAGASAVMLALLFLL